MDFDEIIKKSLNALNRDFEFRNSLFLDVLSRNIDILVQNTNTWFGSSVPKEYLDVIKSLFQLTVLFHSENSDIYIENIKDEYSTFSPGEVITILKNNVSEAINFKNINIVQKTAGQIKTSKRRLYDALAHIFFSISQFLNNTSRVDITIQQTKTTNIEINFLFKELSALPDYSRLCTVFFDKKQEGDKFQLGIQIALDELRNIGCIVKNFYKNINRDFEIQLLFPSSEFWDTVANIKKNIALEEIPQKEGSIVLSLQDKLLEMFLLEKISEQGYTTSILNPNDVTEVEKIEKFPNCKAIIADYKGNQERLHFLYRIKLELVCKNLVIIGSKDLENFFREDANVTYVTIPFEIDTIMGIIDT